MSQAKKRHLAVAAAPSEVKPLVFEEVFRRWAPYVGGILSRLVGPGAHVDDLVQNVFIDVHRGLSGLQEPQALRSWLTTITVRRARKYLGRKRLRRFVGLDTVAEIADPGILPERRASVVAAYRVLDKVKPEERIAWTLRRVEGETLIEVARICGCSRSTADRRIRAVEAAFAKELGRE
ncbi:MAG: RNA polymerase sigma factor [Polyangiales bacterium]